MRIASNMAASIQQAQYNKDLRDTNRNVKDKNIEENNRLDKQVADKSRSDRLAQIKEEIKNGTYKIDLAATADIMARNLLNL